MRKSGKHLFKYLPLIIGVVTLFSVSTASAGFTDWVVDKAGEAAAFALGIDTRDNCTPPQAHNSCLFCPLFKILYNAGSYVAGKSYSVFSSSIGRVILTFLAVCLALIVLKNLASMNAKDPGTLINDILIKTFVCIAIFIIITKDYYNIMNLTIVPVIQTGMDLVNLSYPINDCAAAGGILGFTSKAGANADAGLPASIGSMIVCTAENIETKINLLFENGRWAWCLGTGPHRLFHILPHPVYIIDALLLYLGGIFFIVAYPWVIADAILQLGIAMALLPFAVAGYAFGGTKSYLPKVFNWILHSVFVFIFMAILITCVLDYIANLLQASSTVVDPKILFTDANSGIAFFGPNMLMLIFVLVIGWSYMPMTKELAETFSNGSSGISAAQQTGTQITNAIENQAEKIVDKTTDMALEKGKSMGKSAMHMVSRHGANAFVSALGKEDANGNVVLNIGPVKFTKFKNADGSTYLQREYTSLTGRKHTMASDEFMTIKSETTGGTGTQVKNTVTFKKEFAEKYLFNADGSTNVGTLNKLLNSPLGQNPAYRQAIMEQVAVLALKKKGKNIGNYYTARNVTFDPNNPHKIVVEQIDNTGKKTNFSIDINMDTGQTAVSFVRQRDRNRFENAAHNLNVARKQAWREEKINSLTASHKVLNVLSLGLVKYATGIDANGNAYYTREMKNFLLFGAKKKKIYTIDGTQKTVQTHLGTQTVSNKTVDNRFSEEYEIFFDNGVVTVDTTGVRDAATGDITGEQTKFKYSAAAQVGHESILAADDNNQIVSENGTVSAYLQAMLANDPTSLNLLNLEYGLDNIAGVSGIGGVNMSTFIINNVLAEGRRRKTNKFRTSLGSSFFSYTGGGIP